MEQWIATLGVDPAALVVFGLAFAWMFVAFLWQGNTRGVA
jgi:hypothetical protein